MPTKVPTALKLIAGNPGKRAISKNEPKPAAPRSLAPPAWLSALAKKEWRRVAPELERVGLLTEVDTALLAAYCDAFADMVNASARLAKLGGDGTDVTPNGMVQQHAFVGMKRIARADMATFCKLFGMTPVARTGMDVSFTRNLSPAGKTKGVKETEGADRFFPS